MNICRLFCYNLSIMNCLHYHRHGWSGFNYLLYHCLCYVLWHSHLNRHFNSLDYFYWIGNCNLHWVGDSYLLNLMDDLSLHWYLVIDSLFFHMSSYSGHLIVGYWNILVLDLCFKPLLSCCVGILADLSCTYILLGSLLNGLGDRLSRSCLLRLVLRSRRLNSHLRSTLHRSSDSGIRRPLRLFLKLSLCCN